MAYTLVRQYEKALAVLRSAALRNPNYPPAHLHLLVNYSELGRDEEARSELTEFLRVIPQVSLEWERQLLPFRNPADLERYLAALRRAGLK
jgi:tetratricopeptide (TPR) repeat protein